MIYVLMALMFAWGILTHIAWQKAKAKLVKADVEVFSLKLEVITLKNKLKRKKPIKIKQTKCHFNGLDKTVMDIFNLK